VPKRRSYYRKEFKSLYHKDLAFFRPPSGKFPNANYCAILADSGGTMKPQTKLSFPTISLHRPVAGQGRLLENWV
jgi:hypothetical protein